LKAKSQNNLFGITAEKGAAASLRDLGREFITSGHWNHDIQAPALLNFISKSSIVQYSVALFMNKFLLH
jgi:hypothetical protein